MIKKHNQKPYKHYEKMNVQLSVVIDDTVRYKLWFNLMSHLIDNLKYFLWVELNKFNEKT